MGRHEEIAEYGKLLHENKLVIGAGGNISERDGDHFIIKKRDTDMSAGRTENYVRIPFSGIGKTADTLSSETPLHIACYRAKEDVGAVVHAHSPYSIAAAGKTKVLESVSYEFDCILGKAIPVIDYIQPGSTNLAEAVAEKITKGASAVLLKRHGAISVGKNIEEAYLRIMALERACIAFLFTY